MAKFKPPYGTTGQHVISPAQHFGYRYLVACMVDDGMMSEKIMQMCAQARDENAPKDVVRRRPSGWVRHPSVSDLRLRRRIAAYAAALTQYETELRKEWAARQ